MQPHHFKLAYCQLGLSQFRALKQNFYSMRILLLQAMWRPLPRRRHHAQSQSRFPTVLKSLLFTRTSRIGPFAPISPQPIDTVCISFKQLDIQLFVQCLTLYSSKRSCHSWHVPPVPQPSHCSLWAWHLTDTPLTKEIKKRFMTGPVDTATWKHQRSYSRCRFLYQLCNHWLNHQPNLFGAWLLQNSYLNASSM